jgi:hypothetical protein
MGLLALGVVGCGPSPPGPTPPQPVAFKHSVHIEQGLDCTRCHTGAATSKRAGLPPLETCARCHRMVIPEHPEIQKVMTAWDNREPIQWRKVNVIRDLAMVQFNHGAHARADVECQFCHGDVATMSVAEPFVQVANMGWCLDCHQEREATVDCVACHY